MTKALITPIVALLALIVKMVFGVELTPEQQSVMADGFLALVTVIGLFLAWLDKRKK